MVAVSRPRATFDSWAGLLAADADLAAGNHRWELYLDGELALAGHGSPVARLLRPPSIDLSELVEDASDGFQVVAGTAAIVDGVGLKLTAGEGETTRVRLPFLGGSPGLSSVLAKVAAATEANLTGNAAVESAPRWGVRVYAGDGTHAGVIGDPSAYGEVVVFRDTASWKPAVHETDGAAHSSTAGGGAALGDWATVGGQLVLSYPAKGVHYPSIHPLTDTAVADPVLNQAAKFLSRQGWNWTGDPEQQSIFELVAENPESGGGETLDVTFSELVVSLHPFFEVP